LSDSVTKTVFPYSEASITALSVKQDSGRVSVAVKCTHDLPVLVSVFETKGGALVKKVVNEEEIQCNSTEQKIGPVFGTGIYLVRAEFKPGVPCNRCHESKYLSLTAQMPGLEAPEMHPVLVLMVFAVVLFVFEKRGRKGSLQEQN